MSESTTQAQLAAAVEPFVQALRSYPNSHDDEVWMGTPEFRLTVGDLRRLVRAVDRANE